MKVVDFNSIVKLNLSLSEMYRWTEEVWREQDEFILAPKISIWQGVAGRYMTMPCVLPKYNIAGVKFISRNVDNIHDIPARNSNIMLQEIDKHGLLAVLDGTYITSMRTGACAAFNVLNFSKSNAKSMAIYGLGLTSRTFMIFYLNKLDHPMTIKLLRYKDQAELFIEKFKDNPYLTFEICENLNELFDVDIIVSCVSFAHKELAPDYVYKEGCTIVPVHTAGFQNCDLFFDKIIVDDIGHVEKYRYFEQFKDRMVRITDVVNGRCSGRTNDKERILVYNGGIALHDLYWAMKICQKIGHDSYDVPMSYPTERFWI